MFGRQCKFLFVGHVRFRDIRSRLLITNLSKLSCRRHAAQLDFLINKLGLPPDQAEDFVRRHRCVRYVTPERLGRAVDALLELGFQGTEIRAFPEIVLELPTTIKQRAMLLQEAGVLRISPHYLVNFLQLANRRVSLLKAYGVIPLEVDVAQSMLGHVEEGPGPLQSPGDAVTLTAVQEAVVQHYLCWRLDATPAEVDRIVRTYLRVRNKSVRLIGQTLTILQRDLGFSRDKIMNNGYLIHSHPDNTLRTLKEVPHIRGVPFRKIVMLHPKIVMTPTDTLLSTLRHLEEFGVVDEAVRRNPEVFTLGSDTVRKRLEQIRALPGLSGLEGHPRVLRLVQYLHKARARLAMLRNLRLRCASLHVLCGTQARFERYMKDGMDRTRGVDVVHYLSQALGRGAEELRSELHKHPYWCHVSLQTIVTTCRYLLDQGYAPGDVFRSVHLLLYPWEKVQAELELLAGRPELHGDVFRAAAGGGSVSQAHRLALCLYFIERKYHFTGDGVWDSLTPDPAMDAGEDRASLRLCA